MSCPTREPRPALESSARFATGQVREPAGSMSDVPSQLRLPLRFDPARLKADLALIRPDEWMPHYNERDYGGEWRGVALRSLSGSSDQLAAHDADPAAFANTALHRRCTYLRDVLSEFRCPLKSVRLLSLAPNSFVREHSDPGFGTDGDEVRIHVPIRTSADVEFYLDGERLHLEEGCCYYIDVSRPHRVTNRGDTDRIHLVVDAEMNDWLRTLLRHGAAIDRLPSSPTRYEEFSSLVVNDAELSRELAAISDWDGLIEDVVRRGRRHGFVFDAADVRPRKERVLAHQRPAADWLPAAVHARDARPTVEWAYFGSRRLTEPFFEDSLRAARRNPFARLFQHETRLPSSDSGPPPAGFIFHTSRCGSTLIAQMLAALPRAVVISEAAPIDDVIQAGRKIPGLSQAEHAGWLRDSDGARTARRRGLYVVKLDVARSQSAIVSAAFPEAPWIFSTRTGRRPDLTASPSGAAMPARRDGHPSPHVLGRQDSSAFLPCALATTREMADARGTTDGAPRFADSRDRVGMGARAPFCLHVALFRQPRRRPRQRQHRPR